MHKTQSHTAQNMTVSHGTNQTTEEDVIDIRAIGRMLLRRRWVIINTVFFLCLFALIVLVQLTPRYTATSTLAIETRQSNVVNLEAVMSGMGTDVAAIKTEIDVLKSRHLIGKMVDQLNLINDPEFNKNRQINKGLLSVINPLQYIPSGWKDAILGMPPVLTIDEKNAIERSEVITAIAEIYTVRNPALSYTISLSFESEDSKKATIMANVLADLYLTGQLEFKFEATQRASTWLNDRVSNLRQKVRVSENAVQKFREENQLYQTRGEGLVSDQQLTQINSSLITARTDLARLDARFRQVDSLAKSGVGESGLAEVLDSNLIQRLREQESSVMRKRAELVTRYGPKHPKMINGEAELADIKAKIGLEVNKVVRGIGTEVEVAKSRVASLEQSLTGLKSENVIANRAIVKLREMQRDAESGRVLLETFLARFKETSSQEDLQQADARIISEADIPLIASFPKKKLIIFLVGFASLGIGIGLAFLLEALDNGYRTLDQLQGDLGIRGLGLLPFLVQSKDNQLTPENYIIDKPTSSFAEAHRNVHAALMFGEGVHIPPRVIQVTSSVPGEGKSTFALSLIRLLGKSGLKVLLIEGDLRRPTLAKRMNVPDNHPTFTKCIEDGLPITDSLFQDAESGAMMMAASQQSDPQRVLKNEKLIEFINDSRDLYDLILIDTPPILAVSDVILTSKLVDETIYIVHWEKTSKEAVRSGLTQLHSTGVKIAGSVISQVNLTKHVGYGYGDYGYYYGVHKEYYSN